jgi:hypothetical protein
MNASEGHEVEVGQDLLIPKQNDEALGRWGPWRLRAPAWPILLLALALAAGYFWVYRTPTVSMVGLNYYFDFCLGSFLFGLLAASRGIQLLWRNTLAARLGSRACASRSSRWFWAWLFLIAAGTCWMVDCRIPMRLSFAISGPPLDHIADEALADPEKAHLLAGQWAGLYHIDGVEVIGDTVVLYLGKDRSSYGFARVPGARTDVIDNRLHGEEDLRHHQAFPQGKGTGDVEGRRIQGDWFVVYSWYWLVKVGWS